MKKNLETDELKSKGKKILDEEQVEEIKQEAKRKIEETKKATIEKTEEIKEKLEDEAEKQKSFKILGFKVWRLMAYFVIYSFLGFILETTYGVVTKGVIDSRQSFLYGPFCGIYGVGAVTITLLSQYFNKNKLTLFVGGFLVGSVTEYTISFLVDTILHTKWWDYSNRFLNINGRICLLYSVFWGVLTLFLIKIINPKIDILIVKIKDKISIKKLKLIILIVIIFLAIDCIATCYAQKQFVNRMIVENDIEVENKEKVIENYNKTYNNKVLSDFINTFWNDKKMIRTFPNIKIEDKEYNTVYIDSLLPNIQPYYKKIF